MKLVYKILLATLVTIAFSCSKGGGTDDSPNTNNPGTEEGQQNPETELSPTKATAIVPENGDLCSEYVVIENDTENVVVVFKWGTAQNTTSYKIQVFEAEQEISNSVITNTEIELTLAKGKTYSWQVTSINATSQIVSDTFSFSTPGIPQENYIPYAAEITMNFDNVSNTLTVDWVGSDEDGDELTYDLRILEEETEIVNETNLNNNQYGPIAVLPSTAYTVEVKSKDSSGNISVSTQIRKM